MSKTLLLADDSATIQRVVELTFAQEDIRVVAVADGEQAVRTIDRDLPDIVLADVGMPRMDGYSVSTHVKTSPALQHIPVLLLAGAFEPVDDTRAKAALADGILVKPFEPRNLVNRVQELIAAGQLARAAAASAASAAPGDAGAHAPLADGGHVVPAWYKPEKPSAAERPPMPAIDAADLDQKLSSFAGGATPAVAPAPPAPAAPPASVAPAAIAAAPVVDTSVSPTPPPAATPTPAAPLVLDLGSFTPAHGLSLGSEAQGAPEPLELTDMPMTAQPIAAFDIMPAPASPVPLAAPVAAAPAPPAPAAAAEPAPAPAPRVSLATAFSALLAAEQSSTAPGGLPGAIPEGALEDVVRRILLTDGAIRKVVLDAAERMVKEEIERLTGANEPAGAPTEPETK